VIKVAHDKIIANIILSNEKSKAFCLWLETREGRPFSILHFNVVLEVVAKQEEKKERNKGYPKRKAKSKITFIC
jgi:hypothetical protein